MNKLIVGLLVLLWWGKAGHAQVSEADVDTYWAELQAEAGSIGARQDSCKQTIFLLYGAEETLALGYLAEISLAEGQNTAIKGWSAVGYYGRGLYHLQQMQYDSAAQAFEQCGDLYQQLKRPESFYSARWNQAKALQHNEQTEEALRIVYELTALIDSTDAENWEWRIDWWRVGGIYENRMGNQVQAYRNYQKALDLARRADRRDKMAQNLIALARIRKGYKYDEGWKKQYAEASQLLLEQGDSLGAAEISIEVVEDLTLGKNWYESGLRLAAQEGDSLMMDELHYNYAMLLEEQSTDRELIIAILERIREQTLTSYNSPPHLLGPRSVWLADLYNQRGQPELALALVQRGIKQAQAFDNQLVQRYGKQVLGEINYSLGRFKEAYEWMKETIDMSETLSWSSEGIPLTKAYLDHQFEQEQQLATVRQALEKERLESKIERRASQLRISLVVLFFTLAGGAYWWKHYREKRALAEQLGAMNRQLIEEQQELYESNKRLARFSTGVSHDLLGNLDLILSTGQILVGNTGEPDGLNQYYDTSMLAVRKMKSYCIDLLNTTKAAGPEAWRTDSTQVIADIFAEHQMWISQYGISVQQQELPELAIRRGDLAQVFHNLISNAMKAVSNQPKRQIAMVQQEAAAGFVRIGVQDSGPGIKHRERERVFRAGVSRGGSGRGLGLALVKTIVNENGGSVWITDNEWGGATFWVKLRIA